MTCARPWQDPRVPLKSVPDKESKGAAWVDVAGLTEIAHGRAAVKDCHLRGRCTSAVVYQHSTILVLHCPILVLYYTVVYRSIAGLCWCLGNFFNTAAVEVLVYA